MKGGRELDALVAEKVMGEKPTLIPIATMDNGLSAAVVCSDDGPFYNESQVKEWIKTAPGYELKYWKRYKPYSTDISKAWEVVTRLNALGFKIKLEAYSTGIEFYVEVYKGEDKVATLDPSQSESAPHAICLAALKAVESSQSS